MSILLERSEKARERVVADHRRLRRLMTELVSLARAALHASDKLEELQGALRILRAELERHLDYEERVVAPLVYEATPEGPRRAEDMTKDHAGQRAVLVALTEDVSVGGRDVADLADELAWFAHSFERDMEDEEDALFRDDVLDVANAAAAP
jgi:hypothetical protein